MAVVNNLEEKVPFDDALLQTGYGVFNIFLFFTSTICLLGCVMESMGMMYLLPASQCDLNLSLYQKTVLSSTNFIGVLATTLLWGVIADMKGRRNVLLICSSAQFITSLFGSFVTNAELFIVLRLFNGFFVGGVASTTSAYLGEFHAQKTRTKAVVWVSLGASACGIPLTLIAWPVLSRDLSFYIPILDLTYNSWRILMVAFTSINLISAICLTFLPETPTYLMIRGKKKEALEVLRQMYAWNFWKEKSSFPVENVFMDDEKPVDEGRGIFHGFREQFSPLFGKEYAVKILVVYVLQFGIFFSHVGFSLWYPEVLNMMTEYTQIESVDNVSVCQAVNNITQREDSQYDDAIFECTDTIDEGVYILVLISGGINVVTFILSALSADYFGNQLTLILFSTVTAIFAIIGMNMDRVLLVQIFLAIFMSVGSAVGMAYGIVVELFPSSLRGTALGVATTGGRIGAVVGSNLLGLLLYTSCDWSIYVIVANHSILVFVSLMLHYVKH